MKLALRHSLFLFTIIGLACPLAAVPTSSVAPEKAVKELSMIADSREEWQLFAAEGDSMLPHYGSRSLLLVKDSEGSLIKPGMIVLYRDAENDLVGHSVVAVENGWVRTRGANNKVEDPAPVATKDILGVVIGAFHLREKPVSSLPTVLGKKY